MTTVTARRGDGRDEMIDDRLSFDTADRAADFVEPPQRLAI
jgi:hypothetical protein